MTGASECASGSVLIEAGSNKDVSDGGAVSILVGASLHMKGGDVRVVAGASDHSTCTA